MKKKYIDPLLGSYLEMTLPETLNSLGLSKIHIKGFSNFKDSAIHFRESINVIIGSNNASIFKRYIPGLMRNRL